MNILNMIREQISPDTLAQISHSLGESPEGTKAALEHAAPAILGSAAAQASSPAGATGLFNMITQQMPKLGSIGNLLGSFTGTGAAGSGGPGASFVSSLLGPKMGMVADFISNKAGIRGGSASSLLGMAGSLVMGALGKQMTTQNLDAGGLGQLLKSQVPHLQGLSPDLGKMLGLGNIMGGAQKVAAPAYEAVRNTAATATSSAGKSLKWALIPLALLVAGVLVYRNIHAFRTARTTDVGGTGEKTWTTTDSGSSAPRPANAAYVDQFKNAIARADGTPVELQGVGFDGSGALSSDGKTKLSALGRMLNSYPDLKVSITAYGKTEEEAAKNAEAIKSTLTTIGITADRVTAQPQVGDGTPKISFMK
jgi:hypothetical protein